MLKRVRLPKQLAIESQILPLRIKRIGRARHMRLRYDDVAHAAILTMPIWVRNNDVLEFLRTSSDWLAAEVRGRKATLPFRSGAVIPYRGAMRLLHYDLAAGIRVCDDGERLICGGEAARFAERIGKFLRLRARHILTDLVEEYTERIGGTDRLIYKRVRVGDAKSCWGSCSSSKVLSFSWRLVLLRDELIRYVVVHEVCHLRHMNHSSAFWDLVGLYVPDYDILRRELREAAAEVRMVGVV